MLIVREEPDKTNKFPITHKNLTYIGNNFMEHAFSLYDNTLGDVCYKPPVIPFFNTLVHAEYF